MMKRLVAPLLAICLGAAPAAAQTVAATTNGSVVIATGNTFQTVLAAVAAPPATRRSLTIANNNAADSCWIVIGGALGSATKGIAILLATSQSYTRYYPYIPSDAVHATCASNSDTLYIDTQ